MIKKTRIHIRGSQSTWIASRNTTQVDASGKLTAIKLNGRNRKYKLSDMSSHDQKVKGDLDKQKARVLQYCVDKSYNVVACYDEVGSGRKLPRLLLSTQIA